MGEHRGRRQRRLERQHRRIGVSLPRLLLIVLAAVALVWIGVILAFSSLLANPTGDSGEGRFTGSTVTSTNP